MNKKASICAFLVTMFFSCIGIAAGQSPDRDAGSGFGLLVSSLENLSAPADLRLAGDIEQPLVRLDKEGIEHALALLTKDAPTTTALRIFLHGQLVSEGEDLLPIRESAYLDPVAKTMVVSGWLAGSSILEDIRVLTVDNQILLLRDIYLDGEEADLSLGRSIPFPLDGLLAGTRPSGASAAAPSVTSIAGTTSSAAGINNGLVNMTCGNTWNGKRVINDQTGAYLWRIKGTNFGSAQGTVKIGSVSASITSWSNTQIDAYPIVPYTTTPTTSTLKVTTSTLQQTTVSVDVVPSIRTRIYGQCTWYVASKRLQLGKQPSPTAYGGYSTITASWVPKVGDQLAWNSAHTAIITAVANPTTQTGGYKTYSVTIGEYNRDCRNNFNSYTSDFQVRTVNGQTTITKYLKSSISSMGNATVYYR